MTRRHPKHKLGGGRFAKLPLNVLGHESVITLSHATHRVLVILAAQFTGYNNGALGLSKTQAAKQNISNKTLYRALSTLETHGLIERTYHSSRVPPRPTMFALTWLAVDDTEWSKVTRVPARTFADWKPQSAPKKTTKRRLNAVRGNQFHGGISTPNRGNKYTQGKNNASLEDKSTPKDEGMRLPWVY